MRNHTSRVPRLARAAALIVILVLCCTSRRAIAQQAAREPAFKFLAAGGYGNNEVGFEKWFVVGGKWEDGTELARRYFHEFDIAHPDSVKLEKVVETAEYPWPANVAGYRATFSFELPVPPEARSRYFYILTRAGFVPLKLVKRVGYLTYVWPASPKFDPSHTPKPAVSLMLIGEPETGAPLLGVPSGLVVDSDQPLTFHTQQVPVGTDDQDLGIRNDPATHSAFFNDGQGQRIVLFKGLANGRMPITSGILIRVSGEPKLFLLIEQRLGCGAAAVTIYAIDGRTATVVENLAGRCSI